jgi:hypothetical protein
MNITVDNVKVGEEARVIIELPDEANGNIRVYVDGNELSLMIVYQGTLNVSLGEWPAGTHNVRVIYSGNNKYTAANSARDFTVEKWTTNVTAEPVEITEGETAIVTVNVDANATGAVIVDIDGDKHYADITDGIAIVNIAGLTSGNYTAVTATIG